MEGSEKLTDPRQTGVPLLNIFSTSSMDRETSPPKMVRAKR
jgi:hypothetical protein